MDTFTIGDLEVHRLGFGAMRITGEGIWGPPDDPEEAKRLLHRVVELGIDLIDTADSYGPEVSENLIAEALHPYPDGLVIATKGGLRRTGPGRWPRDARPERLKECCEASLRRLRVDRIDLYQLHAPDPKVPYEESVGALKELQDEGKIKHVGISNVSVDELSQARGIVEIVSVQNEYTPLRLTAKEACDGDLHKIRVAHVFSSICESTSHCFRHQVISIARVSINILQIVAFEDIQHLNQYRTARGWRRHRNDFISSIRSTQRRAFFRHITSEILESHEAVVTLHVFDDQTSCLAFIEFIWTTTL